MTAPDARWDVVAIGANSVDFVNVLPESPQPSGAPAKMRILERRVLCGGPAATAACTCASLGLRSKYVGVSGTDENGRRVRDALARRQVDIADLIVRDADNQLAVILVDQRSGERIVLWDRDERLRLAAGELPLDAIRRARVVHVDDVDEDAAIIAARAGRDAGSWVTSDIDRVTSRTGELLGLVTHAILAEVVPQQLTGLDDAEQALRAMRKTHGGVLCVTLGRQGAAALEGDRYVYVPGFPVKAVDTTGAGDVFRGGFIYAIVQGQTIGEALRFANAAAAVSCTRFGALDGVPTLSEVESLIARGYLSA
jgi:sugar/nucleoside kinase (ribokinase family)